MVVVKNISEVDSALLFEFRQYMLGGNDGPHIVYDAVNDIPLGRYLDYLDAKQHAESLNDQT